MKCMNCKRPVRPGTIQCPHCDIELDVPEERADLVFLEVMIYFHKRAHPIKFLAPWPEDGGQLPPTPEAVTETMLQGGLFADNGSLVAWDDNMVEFIQVGVQGTSICPVCEKRLQWLCPDREMH